MMRWVRSQIALLPPPEMRRIELSLEEALINIVQHSYAPGSEGSIDLKFEEERSGALTFTLSDQGRPFNPLAHCPHHPPTQTLQERKEGGLGIFLMVKLMDHVAYERRGSYNILRLHKTIHAPPLEATS
jgi:anti-sigma regulatory factor (Ser/Thr protein kinase)